MPNSTRIAVKRRIKQAWANVMTAQEYIIEEGQKYEDNYPDHFQMFCGVVAVLEECMKAINMLDESI